MQGLPARRAVALGLSRVRAEGKDNRVFLFCLSPEGSFSRNTSQCDFNFSFNFSLPSFNFFKDYAESPRLVRKPQSRDSNSKLPKKSMLIPKVIS